MNSQLKQLYQQIKERKIDQKDAIKQLKLMAIKYRNGSGDSLNNASVVLQGMAAKLLNVNRDDVEVDSEFGESGFDQILLTEFAEQIGKHYQIKINPAIIFKHPTILALSKYLAAGNRNEFAAKQYADNEQKQNARQRPFKEIIPILDGVVSAGTGADQLLLQEKAVGYFKKLLSPVIGLPPHRIEADAPMEKYGIDSIMVMQLTNQLEKQFGSLPKTLFFEYQNILDLSGYFFAAHRERMNDVLGIKHTVHEPAQSLKHSVPVMPATINPFGKRGRRERMTVPKEAPREARKSKELDIAIIGLAGRYPKADNIQEYWENLRNGKDCITEIPADRWDHSLYFDADKSKPGKTYGKWGGFVEGVDQFDPLFFNISPREAEYLDPQERLFMQCVYEVLEDAGYTREALGRYESFGLGGNVGIYVGVMYEEYQLYGAQETILGRPVALSGNPSSIANRVSYFCNFHGPSMAVDTMCSSSLTTIHLACQGLQNSDCEVAIAGGVNVSIHPNKYLILGQGNFISGKGRCESFGVGGDGYVPGEGVGAILLKPRWKAEADGDHIYGVIKATAINHGGKTNGYSVPNPNAQASVIARAFQETGIDPRTISYIEAHGTGTSLGDPIEIAGLSKAFQIYTQDKQFCALGSAKSNIGHCESAAGIAGVTKVLLQMKHKEIVPSLHAETLNPNIDFTNTPFVVQLERGEWKRPIIEVSGEQKEYPRRAGISSFGAGGSNAHIIIEEYIPPVLTYPTRIADENYPVIIALSAKSDGQLREQVERLLAFLDHQAIGDNSLADIAYTLQVGRETMEIRFALLASSIVELKNKLQGFLEGKEGLDDVYYGQVKRNKETLSGFSSDEDIQRAIASWISKRKYAKLLDGWVKGLVIDWAKFYGDVKPRRISLPTYPFAKERYWVPKVESIDPPTQLLTENIELDIQRDIRFLTKQWEESPIMAVKQIKGLIAILTDETTQSLGKLLSQHLAESQVLDVENIGNAVEQMEGAWKCYGGVIDLLGCSANNNDATGGLLWLQKLIEHGSREGMVLLGVTRGLESFQNSAINMAGASRAGLYRMLQSEYRHLYSRHMDAEFSVDANTLVRQIAEELSADVSDAEVCYRGENRYRSFLQDNVELVSQDDGLQFPEGHVLWITGGTRGLGYLCAQHFVKQHGVKRLVLTGREVMPPKELWDSYSQSDTSVARKIQSIRDLETLGAEVKVLSLSLSDGPAVQEALREVIDTMGSVGGVIHSAGMSDMETPAFIRKSLDGIRRGLEPKVNGLDVMIQNFKDEPLQFFVLFSSVSAIIPSLGAGQSDYAMANAYMDYVAVANRQHFPMVSIQWPSWKEAGMGEVKSRAYEQTGLMSHTNKEGLQFLDHILSRKLVPVVLPAVVNLDLWKPRQLMQHIPQEKQIKIALYKAPNAAATPPKSDEALSLATQKWLVDLFAKELKIIASKLDIETPFQDYGVDSILLTQLLGPLGKLINNKLDPSILLEYPTIVSLTSWLMNNHAESVGKALSVASPNEPDIAKQTAVVIPLPVSQPQEVAQELQIKFPPSASPIATEIAVVGLSCRFPGANNLEEYWALLSGGRTAIRPVPAERWGSANNYNAGVLENVTHFDPGFFLIPDEDAKSMDPQAFLVLEESLNLIYHAGYSLQEVKGKAIGVYIGARSQHQPTEESLLQARNPIVAVGPNYLAANISQFFDFHGPSIVLDTACSSALVGMNMAIQALRDGEITSAIVGGVSLLRDDGGHRLFHQRGILSKDPAFHIFDRRASGIVLGEGVGLVMLKTVSQALEDGDQIHAVIKGMAINNDGRTAGPATPNMQAQKEVLKTALARSMVDPEKVGYVDANGSGSEVTDLLELKAIQSVYRANSGTALGLGSIKPNIGHPMCAEGIASFIKVALMLENGRFVPFLSGEEPMTHFDIDASPFYFPKYALEWKDASRIAAINCFADGGTNAHVIMASWAEPVQRQLVHQPLLPPELLKRNINEMCPAKSVVSLVKQKTVHFAQPSASSHGSANIWKQGVVERKGRAITPTDSETIGT